LNHRQIEIFSAVMKSGTVSRAAEILGITQPAVSRAIAQLECEIGFLLFDRVRSRIVPRPEARLFYRDVEASFRGMDTLRASAARIRDRGSGELAIASLSALGSSLVPKAVRQFRDKNPTVRITLQVLPSRDVRDGVAAGRFDVGLAADEIDTAGIIHQPFLVQRALCAMPPGHRLATTKVIRPHDLADVPFIAYVPEDRSRQRLDAILAEAGVKPRVVVETLYAATAAALAAEGVGVALVSPQSVAGIDPARLVLRPFEPPVLGKSLLILPLDRPKSGLVRGFIDCLMACRASRRP
jgi:DNA-binding transcriptional LysR family regulator